MSKNKQILKGIPEPFLSILGGVALQLRKTAPDLRVSQSKVCDRIVAGSYGFKIMRKKCEIILITIYDNHVGAVVFNRSRGYTGATHMNADIQDLQQFENWLKLCVNAIHDKIKEIQTWNPIKTCK